MAEYEEVSIDLLDIAPDGTVLDKHQFDSWYSIGYECGGPCEDHHVMAVGLRGSATIYGCLNCGIRYERKRNG